MTVDAEYCVSGISIALWVSPVLAGTSEDDNTIRQRPRPLVGADLVEFRSTKSLLLKPPLGGKCCDKFHEVFYPVKFLNRPYAIAICAMPWSIPPINAFQIPSVIRSNYPGKKYRVRSPEHLSSIRHRHLGDAMKYASCKFSSFVHLKPSNMYNKMISMRINLLQYCTTEQLRFVVVAVVRCAEKWWEGSRRFDWLSI